MLKIYKLLLLIYCWHASYFIATANELTSYNKKNITLEAQEVIYDSKKDTISAIGNVLIQTEHYKLDSQKVIYNLKNDTVYAEENVSILNKKNLKGVKATKLLLKNKLKQGIIEGFIAELPKNSTLSAKVAKRVNKNEICFKSSMFTPCKIDNPIWQINARKSRVDYVKRRINYQDVFFKVYGLPVFYLPYFSHPSPSSGSQSGVLVPKIQRNNLVVPFYIRIKDNMDLTITPRFSKELVILDAEYRHKIEFGIYKINAISGCNYSDYTHLKRKKVNDNKMSTKRYYFNSKGHLSIKKLKYGFNLNRASDRNFLAKYQDIYEQYLTSKFYICSINKRNYFFIEGVLFQDLRNKNSEHMFTFILPSIKTQNIINLSSDNDISLNIKSNSILYINPNRLNLAQGILELEAIFNFISPSGHIYDLGISNRIDYYITAFHRNYKKKVQQKMWYRTIPQMHIKWKYPLIKSISYGLSMKIEPMIFISFGQKYINHFKKFSIINITNNKFAEYSTFNLDKLNGIYCRERSSLLSYGINSSFLSMGSLYIDTFLGQIIYEDDGIKKHNLEYIGNAKIDILDTTSIFYGLKLNQHLKNLRSECGFQSINRNFISTVSFSFFDPISKPLIKSSVVTNNNVFSQISLTGECKVFKNLSINCMTRLNLTSRLPELLTQSIRMTYIFDCVSISAMVTYNFLNNNFKGVENTMSKSFSIGLKVLNG